MWIEFGCENRYFFICWHFRYFSSTIVKASGKICPDCICSTGSLLSGISFIVIVNCLLILINYQHVCFYLQFDVKNQRIFLRRTKYDDLHPEDLFVGNRVNVFSRQLNLIDYGDQYTANKLGSKKERYDCCRLCDKCAWSSPVTCLIALHYLVNNPCYCDW